MSVSIRIAALVALLAALPAAAQESGGGLYERILKSTRLPTVTREARVLGVPEQDLRTILTTGREERVSVGVLTDLISEGNQSIREHGPIDNFGAFVQEKLRAGLRGRDLAAAIRAEHAARGIGKGKGRSSVVGKPGEQGGKPGSPGKSGSAGKTDDRGKPDDPGKSGQSGKKGGPR